MRAGLLAVDQEYNYVYPVGSPGVSARYEEGKVLLQAAIYDGTGANTRGIPTDLGPDTLYLAEATWDHDIGVGGWHHTDKGSGLYLTLDHNLDKMVEAFTRVGISPRGMTTYLDAGFRIGPGPLRWRPQDFARVALAFAELDTGDQIMIESNPPCS